MSLDQADEAVRATQKLYEDLSPSVFPGKRYAAGFWAKLIGNSKVVVILATAGYASQAAAVHRISIEHFAYMYSLLKGGLTEAQVEQQMDYDVAQVAKALQKSGEQDARMGREVVTPDTKASLDQYLANPEVTYRTSPGISIYNLLDGQDLKFLHDQYRLLSLHAAHANLLSSVWEPSVSELEQITLDVCALMDISRAAWLEDGVQSLASA